MEKHKLFDVFTATDKLGRRIEALVNFPGIPRGSIGTVVCAQPRQDGYLLVVQWTAPANAEGHLVLWFTQGEYEELLAELG